MRKTIKTYTAEIYMAGDYNLAQQVCREYCMRGLCVTIHPCEYIYKGGQETGFVVGLRRYPKFPTDEQYICDCAEALGYLLKQRLCQESYMLVTPETTTWVTDRGE